MFAILSLLALTIQITVAQPIAPDPLSPSQASELGDVNRDAVVDFTDAFVLASALKDPTAYAQAHPDLDRLTVLRVADFNSDGRISQTDLLRLVETLHQQDALGAFASFDPNTLHQALLLAGGNLAVFKDALTASMADEDKTREPAGGFVISTSAPISSPSSAFIETPLGKNSDQSQPAPASSSGSTNGGGGAGGGGAAPALGGGVAGSGGGGGGQGSGNSSGNGVAATFEPTDTTVTNGSAIVGAGGAEISGSSTMQVDVMDRIIVDFIIGWSSSKPAKRNVGWNLSQRGWTGFVSDTVQPVLDQGVKRIILHNPFGAVEGEAMQFDQLLDAQDAGLYWLVEGFVEAWQPVTDSGVEVIAYIGSPRLDNDIKRIDAEHGREAALAYAGRAVAPLLAAGMNIGYDAAALAERNSLTHVFGEMLEDRGVRLYIEARPLAAADFWHDNPVMAIESFWHRSDPDKHADTRHHARNEQLTGEVVRLVFGNTRPRSRDEAIWVRENAARILADGHTLGITSVLWREYRESIMSALSPP